MIMCTHAHTTQHREGGAPVFAAISGKTHRDRRADCRADYYRSREVESLQWFLRIDKQP